MMKISTKQAGFTLVEALVSISILVMAVVGAFTAAQTGIATSTYSKNQTIAFYLAGEAVEQIRNLRDNNSIAGRDWLFGVAPSSNDPCFPGKVCMVDAISSPTISECSGGTCPNLNLDPANGFYGYDISYASTTIFNRQIRMTQINANEWAISVKVNWDIKDPSRSFEIRENILNWQ